MYFLPGGDKAGKFPTRKIDSKNNAAGSSRKYQPPFLE